jgi:acetolactate synthase I/II/III large subunit
MIKLSDYVAEFIAKCNIKNLFLLPGGGCMHLVDSFGRHQDIKKICCLHEQGAVIAADAYSQYTNNIGAALVTTGPGSTNAITGVAGSWIDSIPLIVISGQAKRQDMMGESGLRQKGVQEVDIVSMVKPITKYAVTVMDPTSIKYHLEKAYYMAKNGRQGPVWLDIPLDVQGATIDEKTLHGFSPDKETAITDNKHLDELAAKTIHLLNNAKRPVIMAGNGIRLADALPEFYKLIEYMQIPVLTTWKSADFLAEDDELFGGRPGSIGQRYANFAQQNCDFFMAIGARMDLAQIGYYYENLSREAKKVIVDIDKAEIDKMNEMNADVNVCANAKDFIKKLLANKEAIQHVDRKAWFTKCEQWKKKYPVVLPQYWDDKEYVNTYVLTDVLSELLTANDVIIPGSSGSCSEIISQAFKVTKGQRIFNNPGLGSMGYGLPASMGASVASGKRTVTIIGDGGLQHNIQELETIHRLQLPLKIFILNNNGYASIRNMQRGHFDGNYVCCDPTSGLTVPDTCDIASAYKIKTTRIINHKDIKEKVAAVLAQEGPVVCDVMVNPDLITAPRLSSEVKPDGTIVSKPLEDLWPFLEREEFKENMIVKPI